MFKSQLSNNIESWTKSMFDHEMGFSDGKVFTSEVIITQF